MTQTDDVYFLVADVGGTNTRVALARGSTLLPDTVRKVRNADADSLEQVLADYVASEQVTCAAAAVAIAGPVSDGRGTLTNLDWSMDTQTLAQVSGAETVAVLNDLQAQAHAAADLSADKLTQVLPGQPAREGAVKLVIGIGTGFNAAVSLSTRTGHVVPASECGHVTLPCRTPEDLRMAKHIGAKGDFASVEDALSGRGLAHVYAWLADEAGSDARPDAAAIMQAASDGSDTLATQAVSTFVTLMGRVAGDLALTHLPFGGIYLIGGVSRAMAPYLDRFGFQDSFRDKGRFADFMDKFPVAIVEDDFAALSGMATHLSELHEN